MELSDFNVPDSSNQYADIEDYGFYVKKGRYRTTEQKGKTKTEIPISNFVMKSVFNLSNGTPDSQRILFIQRYNGDKYFINVLSSEMKPEIFETHLKSIQCTFLGTSFQLKQVFARLMDEEDQAKMISLLGWNSDFRVFAFADALFAEDGKTHQVNELGIITTTKEKYYLPSFSYFNLPNEDYKQQRLYRFSPGKSTFKQWAALFYQAYGKNAAIGITFTLLSVFRDIVFDQTGFFPFLFLFGDAGTGKTQFTEKMLRLFGNDVIGTSLNNATTPGLSRIASQKSNCLVYLKEYTNETEGTIQDFILTAYDGAGRTIGMKTTDNKTKTFSIRSGIIFDGNHLPTQKTAILMRMILLNFENNKFTDSETKAYHELKELADDGFGNVLIEILKLRPKIEKEFRETYLDVKSRFRRINKELPERMIEHNSLIYAMFKVAKNDLSFPYDEETLFTILVENSESHNQMIKENSAVFVFWESFAYNVSKSILQEFKDELGNNKSSHFRIKQDDSMPADEIILQIRYNEIYPHYIRFCRDNSQRFLDKSSLLKILTSESNTSFLTSTQKGRFKGYTDRKYGFCYQFAAKKRKIDDENSANFAQNQILISEVTINL